MKKVKINNRLDNIEEYHFKKLDMIKEKAVKEGKKIYDFSIGDPDLPVNEKIINAIIQ